MQLKLKRSSEETGIFFKKTRYTLDAMLSLTDEEIASFKRHKQWKAKIIADERLIKAKNADDRYNQEVLALTSFEHLTEGIQFSETNMTLIEDVEVHIAAGIARVKQCIADRETFDGTRDSERVIDFGDDGPKIISTN